MWRRPPSAAGRAPEVALLGVLSAIAGLLRPASGRITLDDRTLFAGNDSRGSEWVAPHSRGVALLAQEARLFPKTPARRFIR